MLKVTSTLHEIISRRATFSLAQNNIITDRPLHLLKKYSCTAKLLKKKIEEVGLWKKKIEQVLSTIQLFDY